jgi:Ca-activated chloride channel homolog
MHLVNKRKSFVVLLTIMFSVSLVGVAQTPTQTAAAPGQSQPAAQTQAAPAQPNQTQPTQTPPAQAEPAQGQSGGAGIGAQGNAPQDNSAAPANQQPQTDTSQAEDNGVFVFKKQVEEVVLHATVVDDKDHLIMNLPKASFTVFENGKEQPVTSFRHEDVPVAMGIVIDNSGSMREKRDRVNTAALNLVRASNPQDQVFVVNFNDDYYLDQDFTNNVNKLKEALEKVESRGGTALYDALVASADYLKGAKLQKKVLFVVTDGEDNGSRENLEEAVKRLQQENGPTVYAIGLLGEERERTARRALQVIAERTGGIAFLPKSLDEVDEISSTVAHDIRNQYTIGYKPITPKSVPGYRTIHVEAREKGYKKLTVRTRTGYYPGQEAGNN